MALIHGASDSAILLAVSSRLTKNAKKWYDVQQGDVIESWIALRNALIKIFDRKIPFYKAMQKVEARRWNLAKESFVQYAIDKLALMHRLNLPEKETINLLIGGITHHSVRITALSMRAESIEEFLDHMRQITEGLSDLERKSPSASKHKSKDDCCRNCGKKGHTHQECRSQLTCFQCKGKGHRQYECPESKKRKETRPIQSSKVQQTVAAASEDDASTSEMVATVECLKNQSDHIH